MSTPPAYPRLGSRQAKVGGWGVLGDHSTLGQEAMIWISATGMQRFADVMTAGGVNLNGWKLTFAGASRADGSVIAGAGTNPSGKTEAWVWRRAAH